MRLLRSLCVFALTLGVAWPAMAQVYTVATNPQGSLQYSLGAAIAKVMAISGQQYRVAPFGGSSTFITLIDKGEIDFGLANSGELSFAYTGTEIFDRMKHPNLRMVAAFVPSLSGFIVRADSGMKTVADLRGKRVPIGYTAGRIFHYISEACLFSAGLTQKDISPIPVTNFNQAADQLIDGRVDAAYVGHNSGVVQKAMASIRGGVQMLTLEGSPEVRKRIADSFPSGRMSEVRPAREQMAIITDPTYLFRVDIYIFTHAGASAKAVYDLVKELHAHPAELAEVHGMLAEFRPDGMAAKSVVPFHPGAEKFFAEKSM